MVFFSCTQTVQKGSNQPNVILQDDNIIITNVSNQSVKLNIQVGEKIKYSKEISGDYKTSLLSLLKAKNEYYSDIAYLLAKENGDVELNLNVPDIFDTTVTFHLEITDSPNYTTKVLQGKCARLSGVFDTENVEGDIIKWLYRNNLGNVGDETIDKIRLYLKELNRSDYTEYITSETIPVVTSFKGLSYKVSSDLDADNYYLFACKSEDEIEGFVEDMVSIKFEGAVHSLNQPILCYRTESNAGTICIFLIGIDNDWKYKVSPVGLVSIDNVKPSRGPSPRVVQSGNFQPPAKPESIDIKINDSDIILNKNKINIKLPDEVPQVAGSAFLSTKDWGGTGVSCMVNFVVTFDGDVKSITLKREGVLAKWLGSLTKTIDLEKETSPYYFTFELHLEEGDNYLPVVITDLRGNTNEFKYTIPAHFTRDDTPQINIDNEVNVWN
jgi:hypothetical protein